MYDSFESLKIRADAGVLFVKINNPPMNLLGPVLVADLVSLIEHLDKGIDIASRFSQAPIQNTLSLTST